MSTIIGMGIFVSGPILGALCAIALGYVHTWQLMAGAVLGEGVVIVMARAWSEYVAARTMRRALELVASSRRAAPSAGYDPARPSHVVIRATGLGWRDHLVTVAVFGGFAALVGGLVALVRTLMVAGRA